MVISHLRPPQNDSEQWSIQSNIVHSEEVAKLASRFAHEFGMSDFAKVAGLLHDKGKEQQAFQSYIKYASGYDSSLLNNSKVPHAYVGALIAKRLYPQFSLLISPVIIGHHRGLYDFSEYQTKMLSEIPNDVTIDNISDTKMDIPNNLVSNRSDVHHIIRMLFSCLVDADYVDTESFMNTRNAELRGSHTTLIELLPRLEAYLIKLKSGVKSTLLNQIRDDIQQLCLSRASDAPGFYSLSVPTGGGKTLSSILWAMKHCIKYNKKRIIIAIPYTSIITQTAQILRDIFGSENVLEHHSSTVNDARTMTANDSLKESLATENWDYPIIVTTNVQLFESIYSHRSSKCRKLHNICNSVLIMDEVQVLPLDHLQPILDSLRSYSQLFGVSVLFTSASLPAFSSSILEESFKLANSNQGTPLRGFSEIKEIIPKNLLLHKLLQRTELKFDNQTSSYDDISGRIATHSRVLCIVNTRKDAVEIFNRLPKDDCNIHLSKTMCSAHLAVTIKRIKDKLKWNFTEPIRVISTQLIEAGVDIDFPVVYRAEAGLDSILQAAGRCNREGSIDGLVPVYVFKLDNPLPRGFISNGVNAMKSIEVSKDWYSPETMSKYFIQLYSRANTFDKSRMEDYLYNSAPCFETASKKFKLIDDNTRSVIVNYGKSPELVARLKMCGINYSLRKELLQYSVNLREYEFKRLAKGNIIEEILPGIYFLPDREQYRDDIGLQLESHFLDELLIK